MSRHLKIVGGTILGIALVVLYSVGWLSEGQTLPISIALLFIAGLFRILLTHPRCNAHYMTWLKSTPWNGQTPAPGRNPLWRKLDVTIVLVLTGPSLFIDQIPIYKVTLMCLSAYLIATNIIPFFLARFAIIQRLAFLFPLAIFPFFNVISVCLVAIVTTVVLQRSMKDDISAAFPDRENDSHIKVSTDGQIIIGDLRMLCWPLSCFQTDKLPDMSSQKALVWSSLAAWYTFTTLYLFGQFPTVDSGMFAGFAWGIIVLLLIFGRLGTYLKRYPCGLWFRIRNGIFCDPDYDKIFIAPIVLFITGLLLGLVPITDGTRPFFYAIALFGMLMLTWWLPPSRKEWELTGRFRYVNVHDTFVNRLNQKSGKALPRQDSHTRRYSS